ncbi:MAG: substrate-binding domain-containing protein [Treponema sp.]|nr:substrate-binding domain-containing protein [Treponema sp.]
MKKFLIVMLVLAVAAGVFAAGSKQGPSTAAPAAAPAPAPAPAAKAGGLIKVGIVNLNPSESGYREANVKDMDRVFNKDNGYDVLKANYATLNEQLDAANQFINEGVAYLLISAADANGWDSVFANAKKAGVKVFLFDRLINTSQDNFEAAVVSDMQNQGKNAVAWLEKQNRPGGYKFIHIQGQIGSAAQVGRTEPFDAALAKHSDWTLVRRGTGGDSWSADEAKRIVEASIAAGEKFNVIYAENDGMAEGAVSALKEAGISYGVKGDVWVMGFDFNKFALRNIMKGDWNFDGQCSPFQADKIAGYIKTLESGGQLNLPSKIVINPEIIADNATVTQAFIDKNGLGD